MTYTDVVNMVKVAAAAQQKQADWQDDIKHTWQGIRQAPGQFFKNMVSNEDPVAARTRNAILNSPPLRPFTNIANGAVQASAAAGRALQPAVDDIRYIGQGIRQDPGQFGRDISNTTLGQVGNNLASFGKPVAQALIGPLSTSALPYLNPAKLKQVRDTSRRIYEGANIPRWASGAAQLAASQGLQRLIDSYPAHPGNGIGNAAAAGARATAIPHSQAAQAAWDAARRMWYDDGSAARR